MVLVTSIGRRQYQGYLSRRVRWTMRVIAAWWTSFKAKTPIKLVNYRLLLPNRITTVA